MIKYYSIQSPLFEANKFGGTFCRYQQSVQERELMTWAEYYEKAFEWADRTKIRRLSDLDSFGAADEVYDVATEFSDEALCSRFVEKALGAGIIFNFEQLTELTYYVGRETANRLVIAYGKPLNEDEIVEIEDQVDAWAIEHIGYKSDDDSVSGKSRMRPATEEDVRKAMEISGQMQKDWNARNGIPEMEDRSDRPGCLGLLGAFAIADALFGRGNKKEQRGGGAMSGGIGVDRADVFGRDYKRVSEDERVRDEFYRRKRQEHYENGEAQDEFEPIE